MDANCSPTHEERTMIRTLFVRTMHDSQWTDPTRACAFVGQMVGRSALEVGLIAGADLMNGGWRRHLKAAFPAVEA